MAAIEDLGDGVKRTIFQRVHTKLWSSNEAWGMLKS